MFKPTNQPPVNPQNTSFGRNQGSQYRPAGPLYNTNQNTQNANRKARGVGGGKQFPKLKKRLGF